MTKTVTLLGMLLLVVASSCTKAIPYSPSEAEMRTKPMIESRFSDRFKMQKNWKTIAE